MVDAQIVIPARLASTRLANKLLRQVEGRSILQYTYEAATRSQLACSVVVAVDDAALLDEVTRFGGEAVMTSANCPSGTDRMAEVAAKSSHSVLVNVQGDEPEIAANDIDMAIRLLQEHPEADVATLATPIRDAERLQDPNCVKVTLDANGFALYFSRSEIPFSRDRDHWGLVSREPPVCWQHVGLYAYRKEVLHWFAGTPPGNLEQIEKLEQLRLLEAGKKIVVGQTDSPSIGIDTESDLNAFAKKMRSS